MRKYAVMYRPLDSRDEECGFFLVEARNEDEAHGVLTEELGVGWEHQGMAIWKASEGIRWRSAWRHGLVKVLRATKIPDGVE